MASCPRHLSQLFPSWADFTEAVQDWFISDKFLFKSSHKDRSRADYRYQTRTKKGDCPRRLYVTIAREQDIKVKILDPNHRCQRPLRAKRETCNSQSWLRQHVPKHLTVTRQTLPEEIQDTIKIHYGEIVSYQAAHEIKTTLAGDQKMVHQQLPAYLYPHVDTDLERDNEVGLWFKDASAALLGGDSRQAASSFRRCFKLSSCISSPSTTETEDGESAPHNPLHVKLLLTPETQQLDTKPNSTSLTLRAKHGLTTVFLFAQPSDSLLSIKSQIHELLKENKDNIVTPTSNSADEIILGALIDKDDVKKGFQIIPNQDKKRATVQDAGLKDLSVIGYKIGENADFSVEVPSDDFDDSQDH